MRLAAVLPPFALSQAPQPPLAFGQLYCCVLPLIALAAFVAMYWGLRWWASRSERAHTGGSSGSTSDDEPKS